MTSSFTPDDNSHRDDPVLLENGWTVWIDTPQSQQQSWDTALLKLSSFDTATGFWATWQLLPPPSTLVPGCGLHLFRETKRPCWEDTPQGGKWTLSLPPSAAAWGQRCDIDELWDRTALALIGEQLDSGVIGCVAQLRVGTRRPRLQLWTSDAGNAAQVIAIGRAWRAVMELPLSLSIEYYSHRNRVAVAASPASTPSLPRSGPRASFTI